MKSYILLFCILIACMVTLVSDSIATEEKEKHTTLTLTLATSLRIEVFIDQDGDGVKDGADILPMPSGAPVYLETKRNGEHFRYDTVGNGVSSVTLTGLESGSYQVIETYPDGWINTLAASYHGTTVDTVRFLNFKLISVSGIKYHDLNLDCIRQLDEPLISGVTITDSGNGGGSVVTAGDGSYSFTALGPGTHKLSETPPPGWVTFCPPAGYYRFTTLSGTNKTSMDFGNAAATNTAGCPDNILLNGNFTLGVVPGSMPTGSVANWTGGYTTATSPDVGPAIGCEDSGYIHMWGNQGVGEALRQTLATPIEMGKTYSPTICYRWVNDPNKKTYVRFKLRASNSVLTGPTGGTVIGITPNTSTTSWVTVTLPDWVADNNYTILTISPENNSNVNHGDSTSFGGIDNVCLSLVRDTCSTDTLIINTGYNHIADAVYPAYNPGASNYSVDNYWRLFSEPATASAAYNTITPRLATVRTPHEAWTAPQSNSQWISSHPINNVTENGDYVYRFKFCLKDTLGSPVLNMKIYVDDDAKVRLNGYDIGGTPTGPSNCAGSSCNFQTPNLATVSTSSYFQTGDNIIDVIVRNRYGVAVGLNVQGTVIGNGASVERMECCNDSGSICGIKWLDLNGDGVKTSNEPPIGNWPIYLKSGGSTVQTAYTDNFGYYNFVSVPVGAYTVEEGNPAGGCTQTAPVGPFPVTVTANSVTTKVDFGNDCDSIGTICIIKFNDINRNGVKDPGEDGIPDWLFNIMGTFGATGVTDSLGAICIPVIAGTYTVKEFQHPDWVPTTPYAQMVTVGVGQTVNVEFGNVNCPAPDSLRINTGWNNDATIVIPTGTVDNDWYIISDPDANTTEKRPAYVIPPYDPGTSWANPQANSQWISSYTNAENETNGLYQLEYYFCLLDSLEASLCLNIRADDTASVYLNGNFIGSTGTYTFAHWKTPKVLCTANPAFFKPGKNTIRVDLRNTHKVAMGVNIVGEILGKLPRYYCCCSDSTSGIMGRKWNDANGDGVWNNGENPLEGWEIQLSNGMTTTTDKYGNYYFLFLPQGSYTVTEESQPGWVQTYPASGSYTVELTGCTIVENKDFGNREGACVNPPTGMVAWWKLNEASGTLFLDDAGVQNNGTSSGGPTLIAGKVSNARSFDGANDFIQVPNHSEINFDSSDFSFDAWVRTTDSVGVKVLLDKRVSSPAYRGYEVFLYLGKLHLQISDGTDQNFGPGGFVADGLWHHIAVTVDRNDPAGIKFYVDGAFVSAANPTSRMGSLTNNAALRIGVDAVGDNSYFTGALDEIELFNRVLTPVEVRSLWQADSLGKCIVLDSCLNFGTISPCKCACKSISVTGVASPTNCSSANESVGQLIISADPNSTIQLTTVLPTFITDGSSNIPLSNITAAYSVTGVSGAFTSFNPQVGATVSTGASGDVVVRFGGTICPPKNIPGGVYSSTIILTWKYEGPMSVMNEQMFLCVTATILDDNCCIAPPPNMTAWWSLDETSGTTATDFSGFPNIGAHTNSPTPVSGKVLGALSFNGVDQYVQVGDHNELDMDTSDFSIDAWVRTTDSVGVSIILDKRTATPVRGYSLFMVNGVLFVQLADASGVGDVCSSTANCTNYSSSLFIADGEWHHIAFTVDRTNSSGITYYLDGIAGGTLSDPTFQNNSLSNTAVLRLGARSFDLTDLFRGELDEVEIFKRALTPAEVMSLYLADSSGKCKPNLVDNSTGVLVNPKWNMVSVPVVPPDYEKVTLFPGAISLAFTFTGGYTVATTLDNSGGYWMKFDNAQTVEIIGKPILSNSFTLNPGWNMVGSISAPVDVSSPSIIENMTMPTGIITSSFYGFAGGYTTAASLIPGQGYWVKASEEGIIALEASVEVAKAVAQQDVLSSLAQLNKLTIKDAGLNQQSLYFGKQSGKNMEGMSYELPPVPPEGVFDARFATQRMVELYGEQDADTKEYRINLSSAKYPLTVTFDAPKNVRQTITLKAMADDKLVKAYTMNNHGAATIQHQAVNTLIVKIASSEVIPVQFSLYQCYPNPFNPTTTIHFDISTNSIVSLKVYDILGREVASLIDRQAYEPGAYQTVFDAGNLATGLYFYRITAQSDGKNFVDVKKMMLLK